MLKSTLLGAALLVSVSAAQAEPFTFVALGDAPYGKPEEVYGPYEALIGKINAAKPAFALHIGDIKSGSTPCSDELLGAQLGFMNKFDPAVVYTPGDNEWTDCHREKAGKFDPLERLAYLRKTFFADPSKSLGVAPMAVESQAVVMADKFAGFPENARFAKDGVMFVTAHVVGSNNNLEARDPAAAAEFFQRDAANIAWLQDSFAKATTENAAAVVIAFQANMFEFDWNNFDDETFLRHSGYINFAGALTKAAAEFKKPVLIVFGDSHHYAVTRPFEKTAANVTALEVFGDGDINAVEVMVDPAASAVFGFRALMAPEVKAAK